MPCQLRMFPYVVTSVWGMAHSDSVTCIAESSLALLKKRSPADAFLRLALSLGSEVSKQYSLVSYWTSIDLGNSWNLWAADMLFVTHMLAVHRELGGSGCTAKPERSSLLFKPFGFEYVWWSCEKCSNCHFERKCNIRKLLQFTRVPICKNKELCIQIFF